MQTNYLVAAFAASFLAGIAMSGGAAWAAGYGAEFRQACAPGYHTDREGNCQPNLAQTNRYCPPGAVFHTAPDGWFCDAPSGGRTYYY